MNNCPPTVEAVRAFVQAHGEKHQPRSLSRCELIVAILHTLDIPASVVVCDAITDLGDGRPLRVFGFDLSGCEQPNQIFDWRGACGWEQIIEDALPQSDTPITWEYATTYSDQVLPLEFARQTQADKEWVAQGLSKYQALHMGETTPQVGKSHPRRAL